MSYIKGLVVSGGPFFAPLLAFVKGLSPNRVAVYVTVIANVTAALLPAVTDVGFTSLIAPLAGINAVALMFLKGWHQFEQANYDAQTLAYQHASHVERTAAVSAPRNNGTPNIKLPR